MSGGGGYRLEDILNESDSDDGDLPAGDEEYLNKLLESDDDDDDDDDDAPLPAPGDVAAADEEDEEEAVEAVGRAAEAIERQRSGARADLPLEAAAPVRADDDDEEEEGPDEGEAAEEDDDDELLNAILEEHLDDDRAESKKNNKPKTKNHKKEEEEGDDVSVPSSLEMEDDDEEEEEEEDGANGKDGMTQARVLDVDALLFDIDHGGGGGGGGGGGRGKQHDLDSGSSRHRRRGERRGAQSAAALETVSKTASDPLVRAEALLEHATMVGNYAMESKLRSKRHSNAPNVVRLSTHQAITHQVTARLQRQFGMPSCVTVHTNFIAIGTARGVVMVFDHYQKLAFVLGQEEEQKRAVTALDIAPGGEHLVAGHEHGQVIYWDILHRVALKKISDAFQHPVVAVAAPRRGQHRFIGVDSRGNVTLFSLTKMLIYYNVERQCLLNGNAGAIFSLAVLPGPTGRRTAAHATDRLGLVAVANARMTLLLQLEPDPIILQKLPHPRPKGNNKKRHERTPPPDEAGGGEGNSSDPPVTLAPALDWRRAKPDGGRPHPQLAVAVGRHVRLVEVQGQRQVKELAKRVVLPLGAVAVALQWVADEVLLVLTQREELLTVDASSLKVVESFSLKSAGLVYHKLFEQLPHPCFSGAMRACGTSAILGGIREVKEAKMLSWLERVQTFIAQGKWIDALALALDLFEDGRVVSDQVVGLVQQYVSLALDGRRASVASAAGPGGTTAAAAGAAGAAGAGGGDDAEQRQARKILRSIGSVAIEFCVVVEREEVLLGPVFDHFEEAGAADTLLELFEPYILNDELTALSPAAMRAFVSLYHRQGRLQQVEQCLVHMRPEKLDFEQVVALCTEHRLFQALIYMYNRRKQDFCTPVRLLMEDVEASHDRVVSEMLLLYLSYCFTGRAFPRGALDPIAMVAAKRDLVRFLFLEGEEKEEEGGTGGGAGRAITDKLLELSARHFLRVVTRLFESSDKWEDAEAGLTKQAVFRRLVDIHHLQSDGRDGEDKKKKKTEDHVLLDKSVFYLFAADYLAEHGDVSAAENRALLDRVFAALTTSAGDDDDGSDDDDEEEEEDGKVKTAAAADKMKKKRTTTKEEEKAKRRRKNKGNERQDKLMKLLEATPSDMYDQEALIRRVEVAKMFRVCAYLYKQNKDYVRVLDSYLMEAGGARAEVFHFLSDVLTDDREGLSAAELMTLCEAIVSEKRLSKLVQSDPHCTAIFVLECLPTEHERVLQLLGRHPMLQFQYLQALASEPELMKQAGVTLTAQHHELFVELLCQFEPHRVYAHVLENHRYMEIRKVLALCRQYKINDAVAYLLERTGDVAGALELLLSEFDARMAQLIALETDEAEADVNRGLDVAMRICAEASKRGRQDRDMRDAQALWFTLLDKIAKVDAGPSKRVHAAVHCFERRVVDATSKHIGLQAVMRKLTNDHAGDAFGEFRDTMESMLQTDTYERNVLQTTNALLASDMHSALAKLRRKRARAFQVRTDGCATCNRPIGNDRLSRLVWLFDCGHGFHETCLGRDMLRGDAFCPKCHNSSAGGGGDDGDGHAPSAGTGGAQRRKETASATAAAAAAAAQTADARKYDEQRVKQYMMRLRLSERARADEPSSFEVSRQLETSVAGALAFDMSGHERMLNLAPVARPKPVVGVRKPGAMRGLPPKFSRNMSARSDDDEDGEAGDGQEKDGGDDSHDGDDDDK